MQNKSQKTLGKCLVIIKAGLPPCVSHVSRGNPSLGCHSKDINDDALTNLFDDPDFPFLLLGPLFTLERHGEGFWGLEGLEGLVGP